MRTLFTNDLPEEVVIKGSVAIDTEAMGLKPRRDRLCLVQLATNDDDVYLVQFKNHYEAPNLVKILNDPKIKKIFHYGRFDIAILMYYLKCNPKNIFCTKIASFLARTYTDRHSLKLLIKEFLAIDIEKHEQTSFWGADQLTEKQLDYAAQDVIYLHKLYNQLTERLKKENRLEIAEKCFDFLPVRAQIDLDFDESFDIFSHRVNK